MSEEVAQCEKFVNKDQLADVMQTQGKMKRKKRLKPGVDSAKRVMIHIIGLFRVSVGEEEQEQNFLPLVVIILLHRPRLLPPRTPACEFH